MQELEFWVFKGCILSAAFLKEMAYHMKEGIYEGLGLFSKDRHLWMYVMEIMSLLTVIIVNYPFITGVPVLWLPEAERGRPWFMRETLSQWKELTAKCLLLSLNC